MADGDPSAVPDDLDAARLLQSSYASLVWLGREACYIILPLNSEWPRSRPQPSFIHAPHHGDRRLRW